MMIISLFRRLSKGLKNKYSKFLKAFENFRSDFTHNSDSEYSECLYLVFCVGHENKPLFVLQIFSPPCGIEMSSFP
jgi:hypothetical protein